MMTRWVLALSLSMFMIAGCEDTNVATVPPPQEPTRAATGYYCNMTVIEHPGPKGHIFLSGESEPIWFSSVRDAIAFTMLPEESKDIAAIYVNDMAAAMTWEQPEPDAWIMAHDAWYVVGSNRRGGMGAPEAVPFGDKEQAHVFSKANGGIVVAFGDIPEDAILGNVAEHVLPARHDAAADTMERGHADTDEGLAHMTSGHDTHEVNHQ